MLWIVWYGHNFINFLSLVYSIRLLAGWFTTVDRSKKVVTWNNEDKGGNRWFQVSLVCFLVFILQVGLYKVINLIPGSLVKSNANKQVNRTPVRVFVLCFSVCDSVSVTIWTCSQGSPAAQKKSPISLWKTHLSPTLFLRFVLAAV